MRRKEVDDVVVFGKMICPRLKTHSEWFMRTPRDAYPGAQTCMDSNMVRADFGSGLIRPKGSNKFRMVYESAAGRIYGLKCGWADFGSGLICPRAQTCCASPTRTPARLANSPGFKSFRCPRWRIKFSLERFSDPSCICLRAQPLKNSAGRVPQAADGTCNKIS